jgi:hypothetical protein
MFLLIDFQRYTPPAEADSEIDCQVVAYDQDGNYADTQHLPTAVDCIKWAGGNACWASRFEIINVNWDHMIVGHVENKIITWGDEPIPSF